MFIALLDTCVLWPSLQRDFLLSLGIEGVYRPIWSEAILAELEFHEARKLVDRGDAPLAAESRAAHLIAQMRDAFDDAVVVGWEPLEGSYGLHDPDDEHVIAAAQLGGAGAVVTHNLKDFPRAKVPATIKVVGPAEFAFQQAALRPAAARRAIEQISSRSGRRGVPLSPSDVITLLEGRYGMRDLASLLRET